FSWFDQARQQLRRVQGGAAGEVLDLQPAREARGDDDRVRGGLAQRREQPLFADEARHLVILLLVAERPGHAAAAGVEVEDLGPGNAPQKAQQWPHADQGALVAVALDEDFLRTGAETLPVRRGLTPLVRPEVVREFLERPAHRRDGFGFS